MKTAKPLQTEPNAGLYRTETSNKSGDAATPALVLAGLSSLLSACGGGDDAAAQRMQTEVPKEASATLLPKNTAQQARATTARAPTAEELFAWAERSFPALFGGSPSTQTSGDLKFRAYPNNLYLGVNGTEVLALGPITQGQVMRLGGLADFPDAAILASMLTDQAAARFLLHTQFSASEEEIAAVRAKGYAAWLDEQLALPNKESGWDWLVSKGYSVIDTNEFFFAHGQHFYMVWYQLTQSPDAVRRRWAWALSEVFVVSWRGIKDVMNWDGFGMAEYWDILCREGFGSYRDLLEALTLNPAMGAFLSTRGNMKEDAASGRLPDENYAREVMQLFSVGLHELNLDGTVKRNAAGRPLETYTSDDVSNLARVFTGYNQNYSGPQFASPKPPHFMVNDIRSARDPMVFEPRDHSLLEKRFLGVTIPANTQGPESLRIALDTLANHPTTAPFLCRQFIQRMVTSNPSPAYVQRVSEVFNNNGNGKRGDLKAVLKAILLDDEAMNSVNLNSPTFGKLRSPVLRIAQWARTFKAKSVLGTWKMRLWDGNPAEDANQYVLNPPSVFSYYRPGYVPPGTALASAGSTAPEFQIVNESSVAAWVNLLQGFLYKGFYVNAPNQPGFGNNATDGHDIVPDYGTEKALVANSQALVDRLNLLLCAGQHSPATVQLIVTGLQADRIQANSSDDFKQIHVARALMFVMCSAEYMAQR